MYFRFDVKFVPHFREFGKIDRRSDWIRPSAVAFVAAEAIDFVLTDVAHKTNLPSFPAFFSQERREKRERS